MAESGEKRAGSWIPPPGKWKMTKNIGRKPKTAPATPFPAAPNKLHEHGGWLWIPLRDEWRNVAGKPEETVRQHFIRHLCNNYGYALDQMDQERRTMHGRRSPRADIVIWETHQAKASNKTPVLVIECKAENIDVNIKDYYQGESYSRAVGCEFFIAHNARYTAIPLHTARGNSGTTPVERTELGHGIALLRHRPVWSTRPWSLWSDQPRDQPKHATGPPSPEINR